MQGDLLFFLAQEPPTFFERVIMCGSKSKIVHVGIDIGGNTMVEAINQGIVMHGIGPRKFIRWEYKTHCTDFDQKDMDRAIRFVEDMAERNVKYGWQDIATAANPFQKFFYVIHPGTFDCSALATEFLDKAGGIDLGGLELDPHVVTPAKLFKQLGLSEVNYALSG